jgi:hypothetical protein
MNEQEPVVFMRNLNKITSLSGTAEWVDFETV